MEKERVDLLVVQQGLTDSREKAKRLVMAGQIVDAVKHIRYDKPGEKIPITTELYIKGETLRYVSRGGLKLEKALATCDVLNRRFYGCGTPTRCCIKLCIRSWLQSIRL